MNKYSEILAFTAAAENGSLTKAASELKMTSGMLGRRITSLERRLGAKLLHRTPRHMSLTEQGTIFLDQCRDLLTELQLGEFAAFPDPTRAKGELFLVAPAYFGRRHVAAHVKSFVERNPDVRVSFDLTNNYVDPLHEGHDLCIRIGNVIEPNFVATRLASNRRVVCATPDYLARHGRPRSLYELGRHNCLAVNLPSGRVREWLFQENGRPVSVKVSGAFDCNDGEVLATWVLRGECLAWRSTWEIAAYLASGELVTVLDEFALRSFDIYAIYRRHNPLTASLRLFIETLESAYSQPGYWANPQDRAD